jgi:hypothetical protein
MPILCDFELIVGDEEIEIPHYVSRTDLTVVTEFDLPSFSTTFRLETRPALLMLSVRGVADATVVINNAEVGTISRIGMNDLQWFMQTIAVSGVTLSGNFSNTISLRDISRSATSSVFSIKDVVCFFHQDSVPSGSSWPPA